MERKYPPHIERMKIESHDLLVKITAGSGFLTSPKSHEVLDDEDRELLTEQIAAMGHYHTLLGQRIEKEISKL